MYKINSLNYKYDNHYYFQVNYNKCIKFDDCNFIEMLRNEESFSETYIIDMLKKYGYSKDNIIFLKENNIIISEDIYKNTILNILENLIRFIEYEDENQGIKTIFVYSPSYGYRTINIVKAAIELDKKFTIERMSKNDMRIKFTNGYVYDINTRYNIFGENIVGCNITKSKALTNYLLSSHNIKVPKQRLFYIDDLSNLIDFIEEIKYPICLKPDNLTESKDVFPCIKNQDELDRVINYYRSLYNEFVVEENIPGNTYRLYYCYGRVIGAIQKCVRFIEGDGINTINTLINTKYKRTMLRGYTEECSFALKRLNLNKNDILPAGKKIYIGDTGTDSDFNIFDIAIIDPYFNELAKRVSLAIGLNTFAIDLIAESLYNVNSKLPTILEIQEGPEFGRGNKSVNNYYTTMVNKLSS